jgi:hypothetical protein
MLFLLFLVVAVSGDTVLFSDNVAVDGLLGNRSVTTQTCRENPFYTALECNETLAFLGYSGELFTWGAPPALNVAQPVTTTTGTVLASNWTALFNTGRAVFSSVVTEATWWSGIDRAGNVRFNCADWETNAVDQCVIGAFGKATVTTNAWIYAGHVDCSTLKPVICICYNGRVTTTPSRAPTGAPWLPTEDPTLSPTS